MMDRYPMAAVRAGEITTALVTDASPASERSLASGSVPSMVAHPPLSSSLPMEAPLVITAGTGSLPAIDRFSKPTVRTDDVTTARLRALPPSRALDSAPPMNALPPALSTIEDADTTRLPRLEPPGLDRAAPVEESDALIDAQIRNLVEFARINARDARRDRLHYWALKGPAIAGATAASTCAALGYGSVVIILAALAAICAAVDGVRPGGLLEKVHRKASKEAYRAAAALQAGWHLVQLECDGQLAQQRSRAADLLRAALAERQKITNYVTAAEADLGGSARRP